MKHHKLLLFFFLLATLLCAACNTIERDVYRTLVAIGHTYDATMQALAEAHAAGTIPTAQYAEAKRLAYICHGAFHTARIALEEYVAAGEMEGTPQCTSERERLMATITALTLRVTEFTEYARSIRQGLQQTKEPPTS